VDIWLEPPSPLQRTMREPVLPSVFESRAATRYPLLMVHPLCRFLCPYCFITIKSNGPGDPRDEPGESRHLDVAAFSRLIYIFATALALIRGPGGFRSEPASGLLHCLFHVMMLRRSVVPSTYKRSVHARSARNCHCTAESKTRLQYDRRDRGAHGLRIIAVTITWPFPKTLFSAAVHRWTRTLTISWFSDVIFIAFFAGDLSPSD
jgi:hypothetical protein